jgi:hypothetical protein
VETKAVALSLAERLSALKTNKKFKISTCNPIQDLNLPVTSRNGFGTKGHGEALIVHDDAGSCGVSWVESSSFTNWLSITNKTDRSPFEFKHVHFLIWKTTFFIILIRKTTFLHDLN